ncbi:gp16 family protein [Shewanella glacialimarina]|uniref:gp16 family protein n=1 Tax=Shewanella glacialimarina TaxID=2590884 RepID=UPI001CF91022|nr:regulatory protein GemA [Shewanella glacialimarina]UCX05446.1 regulatory protein GemA [Shewanella glacialimarina]
MNLLPQQAAELLRKKNRLKTLINVAKGQLGLEDDLYRTMLKSATSKDSLKAMTLSELEIAFTAFKNKGFEPKKATLNTAKTPFKGRLSQSAGRSKVAIIDKIVAIWITMSHHMIIRDSSETALDAYVRRMTLRRHGEGVDSVRWLDQDMGYQVLESLKNWHKRELIERIIARGEQPVKGQSRHAANYEVIVEQYQSIGRT